jgi:lysophospholipase L1-like esterase
MQKKLARFNSLGIPYSLGEDQGPIRKVDAGQKKFNTADYMLMRAKIILFIGILACAVATGQTLQSKPDDAAFAKFKPLKAPATPKLQLKPGDRLAICGDSITEQKMYSRIMEDYLTMCAPELNVSVRQYGWGGERASGFLARMTNDCLRFHPTIATTCYGMNDFEYRPYEQRIGQAYRQNSAAVDEAFAANGARVIQGSPGCVGKIPRWTSVPNCTAEEMNLSLCELRNIGIELAQQKGIGFADVFWPMLTARAAGQQRYGANYALAGADGVHPNWAGHTVMAYAFLKALGLKGEIGTLSVNLKRGTMTASSGHEVLSAKNGEFEIRSARYPFCACEPEGLAAANYPACGKDDPSRDSSIRSGMTLVPFNQDLNRFMLIAKGATASSYRVTWGGESKIFTGDQLARGVNLAMEFSSNPFTEAFARVDAAVAAKQAYETIQIKQGFHSPQAKADMEAVVARTEKEREPLAAAIKAAFVPVTHTLAVVPEGK